MSVFQIPLLRRRSVAVAVAVGALSAGAAVVVPSTAQAFVPGFPDLYCYAHQGSSNPTRLWLGESNIVNGDPRLAYTIITQVWDDKKGAYVPTSASSKYALPPSDRSASGICRWADPSYPIGTLA